MWASTGPRSTGQPLTMLMRASCAHARTLLSACAVYLQASGACTDVGELQGQHQKAMGCWQGVPGVA